MKRKLNDVKLILSNREAKSNNANVQTQGLKYIFKSCIECTSQSSNTKMSLIIPSKKAQ